MDNNRTARGIKSFVIGRKNLVFANCTQNNTVIFRLIAAAKKTVLAISYSLAWVWETASTLGRSIEHWTEPLIPSNAPMSC